MNLRRDVVLPTALMDFRLDQLRVSRRRPNESDEAALLSLSEARLKAIAHNVRIEAASGEMISVARFERVLAVVAGSMRRHASEDVVRRVQADIRAAVAAEGYLHGDDAT